MEYDCNDEITERKGEGMSEFPDQWCGKCKHYQRREPVGIGQTGDCTVTIDVPIPDCFKRHVVFASFGARCAYFKANETEPTNAQA